MSAAIESVLGWLERFGACVRAQDFEGGRALFAPEARGFGTVVEQADDLDKLEAGQWRRIWPHTRGFRLLEGSRKVLLSGDGSQACVLALWESEATAKSGPDGRPLRRRGRCTLLLERDETASLGWRAIHSHFSKQPGGEI